MRTLHYSINVTLNGCRYHHADALLFLGAVAMRYVPGEVT